MLLDMADEYRLKPEDEDAAKEALKKFTKQQIEKQQKDTEDPLPAIEEEDLEQILEKMITINFEKEEDIIEFFDQ